MVEEDTLTMKTEDAKKMLEEHTSVLGEQFDSVQILVTWHEDENSRCCKIGCGNWYARIGSAQEFLNENKALLYACTFNKIQNKAE